MNSIEQTRLDLIQVTDRMLNLLAETPEERLTWRPSESSRTILEIVAHTAHALGNIAEQMKGNAFAIPSSTDANAIFLEHDRKFVTREEAVQYLEEKRSVYLEFLDSLTEADLDRLAPLPFGLGEGPISQYMAAGYNHTLGHIGQIEYIQTMYGDHDWHFGF